MHHAASRLALVFALAWPATAQIGAFEWTLQGNVGGSGFATPTNLHVVGPDNSGCTPPLTWLETVLPVGGTLHVLLDFQNLDLYTYKYHADFDGPAWLIDGAFALPTTSPDPSYFGWPTGAYEIDFEVEAGQHIGLGVWALDCAYGPGVADYHELVLVPKPWSTHLAALDPRALWTLPQPAVSFGPAMAAAGDVDLDGQADLVLAGLFTDTTNVHILSGADGATLLSIDDSFFNPEQVAGVGDVDGDGVADIAVGHPTTSSGASLAGKVVLLSGATGAQLAQAGGDATWDELGDRIAGVGDVDLDGVPDVAARLAKVFSDKSEVRVISGATGAVLHAFVPIQKTTNFGKGLAGPGDLTGDGVPDILVGTPYMNSPLSLYSGASGFLAKSFLNPGLTSFGAQVAAAGDVDADGTGDVIATASGHIVVFSGQSAAKIVDIAQGVGSVAGGFDVNGDGRLDLVAGPTDASPGGALGVYDALDGSLLAAVGTAQPQQALGSVVAMPGDLDGDGLADVAGLAKPWDTLSGSYVRTWSQLQHAGPPTLAHAGDPVADQLISVTVANAQPGAPGFFVVGGSLMDLPIAGGVLAPSADVVIPVVADPSGSVTVSARWPAGLPTWTSIWMQAWMADPAGPAGFSASDALAASQL